MRSLLIVLAALAGGATLAVLLAAAYSGAAAGGLLGDPGAAVRWSLPVAGALADVAGTVTLGTLVVCAAVLPFRGAAGAGVGGARPTFDAGVGIAAAAAAAWALLTATRLILTYAKVAGQSPTVPGFDAQLGLFVTDIELGRLLLQQVLTAAVVTALALLVRSPAGVAVTTVVAGTALWAQAQSGHASGASSHSLATSAMLLHLIPAAVWIGGLTALALLLRRLGDDLQRAVARYSVVAASCVAAVAFSGVVNATVRLTGWGDLTTRYGVLLVVKTVLTVVLAGIGWVHRRSVIPGLAAGAGSAAARRLFWRLVVGELAVMGAVVGVAVALAATAPPVPDTPVTDPTPAEIVTGAPLPPDPTLARWFTEWSLEPVFAFAAIAGVVVYLRWALRLRRRGDRWPVTRTVVWVLGMVMFFWTTSGGPAVYGHVIFSGHMLEHMTLVMVIPVLLVLASPVTLALRALPSRAAQGRAGAGGGSDASRGPREWLLALVQSRWGQFFANPLVAALNFAGSMTVFYYSGLFEWSLRSHVGHWAMVVHFSLAGYLFVNAIIGQDPGPKRPGYPQRLLLLFATMAFHAFFGVALTTGDALLVPDWFGLTGRPWGPDALADQQRGGAIAWGIGELPTLAMAVAVAWLWSRSDDREAIRRDRRVDRDGDAELEEYNRMLARLNEAPPQR